MLKRLLSYKNEFLCTLLYVHSNFAIILMGKRELVTFLSMSSWCLVMVVGLFLAVPWVCLWFVIVVFPDNTNYLLPTWCITFSGALEMTASCVIIQVYDHI